MDDKLADRRKHPRILQLIFYKTKRTALTLPPFYFLPYGKHSFDSLIVQ